MQIHVGTSGYNYPEWKGTFYPDPFPASKMFGYYSERFRTVEINYTFYRMPTPKLTDGWREQAPDGFSYTLKAPKRITHDRRLVDCAEAMAMFVESARRLQEHLACLLFQLPPNFRVDIGKLEAFLALIPSDLRAACEFRHDSWHCDDVFGLLSKHNVALCIADMGDKTTPLVATAKHGYFRLRDEGYGPADITKWTGTVKGFADKWTDAFVYFKHEDEGKGPEFAKQCEEQL
ncbi:MAG: DUF72 domain-containing protein [Acidimicrobiia bacterium]|nr:DUF72 domain-containing protein [Acidimicrobiia bacterium]